MPSPRTGAAREPGRRPRPGGGARGGSGTSRRAREAPGPARMVTAAYSEPAAPEVEIVVPVYNEEHVLGRSIRRLHAFLSESFPFSWRIVVADNASTDGTLDL